MKILTSKEMQFIDESTIKLTGIPSLVLMENAGRQASQIILDKFHNETNFVIIAGSGNNGGDGLVIARYLFNAKKSVKVFLLTSDLSKVSNDNKANLNILEKLGVDVYITDESKLNKLILAIKSSDVVIDAIFGTGFKPPVKGYKEKVIRYINTYAKKVVSVDIPSGLSADTYTTNGEFIQADITITFGYPKICHILYPSAEYCGKTYIVDISLDSSFANSINRNLLIVSNIKLPVREKDSHKYKFGHNLVIGGSVGKSGAVMLSGLASTIAGAGLTSLFVPEEINYIVEQNLIEEMSIPAPSKKGEFSKEASTLLADIIKNGKFSSITIGMGMGTSEGCIELVKEALKQKLPVVIDADGINSLVKIENFEKLLLKRKYPTILTPHLGEFSRLVNLEVAKIKENLEEIAINFAKKTKAILVIKFSRTLVVSSKGELYYSIAGNEGMAKAGSGDVLAGIIGALVNRLEPIEAVKTGVLIHGISGDITVKEKGKESLRARDIIYNIPKAYKVIEDFKSKYQFVKKLSYFN